MVSKTSEARKYERSEADERKRVVSSEARIVNRKFCVFHEFKRLRWLKIACFLVRLGEGKVSEKMSVFRELFIPAEGAKCPFLTSCTSYRHNLVFLRG